MNMKLMFAAAVAGTLAVSVASAGTIDLTVGSESDIFLAGQSSVPTKFPFNSGAAGLGAGVLPPSINVSAGETLTLNASGVVSCCLGGSPTNGPNGGPAGFGLASISGYGNVGGYSGIAFPLVGVFGGPSLTAPWTIFVVGAADIVNVPTGATQLYLGLPDSLGFGLTPGYYNDNTGSFAVQVSGVPEPSTWAMMLVGFAGLGLAAYRRTRNRSASFAATA